LLTQVSGTDALLALVALAAGTVDAIEGGGRPLEQPGRSAPVRLAWNGGLARGAADGRRPAGRTLVARAIAGRREQIFLVSKVMPTHASHRVLPWCVEHEVVVGYSPFGSGDFPAPGSRGGEVLADVARAHGATPYQITLAFLTRAPHLFAIPKSTKVERVRANAGAAAVRLSPAQIAALEEAFPVRRGRGLRRSHFARVPGSWVA